MNLNAVKDTVYHMCFSLPTTSPVYVFAFISPAHYSLAHYICMDIQCSPEA